MDTPANLLQDEGTYSEYIPSGTRVPRWAYLKPSDYRDFFSPGAAISVGGESGAFLLSLQGDIDCDVIFFR